MGESSRSRMGDNSRMPAVLIVEDSENSAAMLEIAFLGIPGVSVLMAPSAVEALRILDGGSGAVRVMVTDLNMPRMDGYELIRRVRADQKALGYAYHRSERRYRPGNSAADRGVGSGSVFPETVFAGVGAPETGATSRWQDALVPLPETARGPRWCWFSLSRLWGYGLHGAMPGAGDLVRADGAGPGENPGAAGPAGTGESRALRAGTRVAGAVGNARAAATHGGGTARHPAAAHRRAGADQSGSVAKVSPFA